MKLLFIKLILIMLSISIQSSGQWFQPTLRITSTIIYPENHLQVFSGIFEVHTRRVNIGIEFTNEFRLYKKLHLETGIRYSPIQTNIVGLNQIDSLLYETGPINWKRNFGILTLPILFSKYFSSIKNRHGKYFIGCSVGFLASISAEDRINGGNPLYVNFQDSIASNISGINILEKDQFFASLDLGVRYYPFRRLSNFEIGLIMSYQLNNSRIGLFHGKVVNLSKNQTFNYHSLLHQRFINLSISLGYRFGKGGEANYL